MHQELKSFGASHPHDSSCISLRISGPSKIPAFKFFYGETRKGFGDVIETITIFMGWELLYVLVVHPEQLLYWRNLQQLDNFISSLFITLLTQQVTASRSCERQRCPASSQEKPSFLGRESFDSGHEPTSNKFSFNILQINIKGWTSSKKEVLQKIATDKNVMVVLVQETHQNNPQNLKLSDFVRANHIPHAHHGIVTFVRNSISF